MLCNLRRWSCTFDICLANQYILFSPLFLHLKHFEASALLCAVHPAVMESRDLVSVSRRVSRPVFSSLGLKGLRSRLGLEGFRSRSRALRLETLHRLFFMKFCNKEFILKTVLKNDCSKFSRSTRSVAKLYCCYVVCEMEKTICPLRRLKFILNLKKMHQWNRSA